ncbi:signal recognition particle-docking protein FtsY [Desulfurobacterium indicum]|uniref:signal recognition particle-docking protein FtsY n=1 Tax=Desulfurobacterium indicum TaxID=1914305 RepID=UPI0009753CA1|nr:signal recognition particle-docking protein FtsY [Desulfurobacterium indicum]
MLGFFKRKGLREELKENPNQPEKWLKLAEKENDGEALSNAIIYSNGNLVTEAVKIAKEKKLIEETLKHIPDSEKEIKALFAGLKEKENNKLSRARNFFETAFQSGNKKVKFFAGYNIAEILKEEGLNEEALKIVKQIEAITPDSEKKTLQKLKKELEEKTGKRKAGFFKTFKEGLKKTREALNFSVFKGREIDEELFEELEERLILADIGVKTSLQLIDELRKETKKRKLKTSDELLEVLKEKLKNLLSNYAGELRTENSPSVILVLGVNGVGKTTTIGKLAKQLKDKGKSVLLAAADTFRAAAIEQLEVWAERADVRIVKGSEGADPASVVFDAVQSLKARGEDILIVDTAGRLHNKDRLMKEIKKIKKVISREIPGEPSEILLVLDANTGQNAISQAKAFKEITDVTGIVLTKLDGTAKGGIVVAIASELKIPIKYIGIGEKIEDLRPFNPEEFVEELFS